MSICWLAADDLSELAPYLVQLEEESPFTRNLMTDIPDNPAPWHLWRQNACVFFRAPMELDAMWKHLRKFTRLKDDEDKWYMVRFWDPYIFWHGVAFGNQLYAELLKPVSFGISCRADQAIIGWTDSEFVAGRKQLGVETRQNLMVIWSIGELTKFMQVSLEPMVTFYEASVFDVESFCAKVLQWCQNNGIVRLRDVSRYCIAHAYLGLGFDSDPRMPSALHTQRLQETHFKSKGGSEALMKNIRRDHAALLDLKTRWENARSAIAPNGPYVTKFRTLAETDGYDATVTALVKQLNQLIFGCHYRENNLVRHRVLKTPAFADEDALFLDLCAQIDIHLKEFP